MPAKPPADSTFAILGEPQVCSQCQSVSRLTNGLCLNCLLRGALDEDEPSSDKDAFKEVLASVKSRDGDWHIADHEILHEIARGGMGVVYQAREPNSGRVVALKCILVCDGDADHAEARFRREAETAARLEHPNIVPIYHVGETADGFPYYTMKYASAGSLLQARHPLLEHPRQSAALMMKVARAVHYAHEQGVLHRDLKPGNILLDSHGEPLVSDFGLARCEAVSSYLTRSLSSFGTPGYVAPEQADGPAARLTPAADVYSLGAIFFELLTGRTPFVGDNAFAVMKQSAEEKAPKVRSLAPQVDRDLEIICDHCLEREPADRYQSAGELADDLQSWLDHRPIRARVPNPWLRTRRWVRRNRALAASFAALVLVGAGSLFWYGRTQHLASVMNETILATRSVMVLPFLDLDRAREDPVSTRQVIDILISRFKSFGPARVLVGEVPRWRKVEDLQQLARASKARTILTGTVRNVQGRMRVSIRVLDPSNGEAVFAKVLEQNEFEGGSQTEAENWARNIYNLLSTDDWTELTGAHRDPGARNLEANEAMRAGREAMASYYTVADLDHAIVLFKKAITLEPNSALAHAYLAMAAASRTHFVADSTYLEQGKREALKAVELGPTLMDAHRALAGVYYQEGKFDEALEEEIKTIENGGITHGTSIFVGMILDIVGRPDRALNWYEIAAGLKPQPGEADVAVGDCWTKLADDERAFRAYDRAIELQPSSGSGAVGKCRLHILRGEFEAAREICRTRFRDFNDLGEMAQIAAQLEFFSRNYERADELYSKLIKDDAHGGGSFYGAITYQSALGRIRQALGANDEATKLLSEALAAETAAFKLQPRNSEAAYRQAAVEACLNQTDNALQHLRQAIALGWLDYRSLQRDPRFDSLRLNPELDILIDGLSAKVAELSKQHQIETK
ncbi:MAG TPA: protein kinase [Chthoniobacterales bacterium]|jgi:tetratricopeptide (TPR) repeat protein|nr:protein kinase [Chthoniobacterales bacterium]